MVWVKRPPKEKSHGPSEATAQRDRSLKIPKYGMCPLYVLNSHLVGRSIILLRRCIIFAPLQLGQIISKPAQAENMQTARFPSCIDILPKLCVFPHVFIYPRTAIKYRETSLSSHFLNLTLQSHKYANRFKTHYLSRVAAAQVFT